MWSIFDVIVFVAGFAACWFSMDRLVKFFDQTVKLIRRLKAKVKAIRETL